ncbi:MAG: glycosyltransferase [bacterium]
MKKVVTDLIKKNKTVIKFIISGCTAAAVDLLFLYIFHGFLKLNLIFSVTAAYLIAFIASFSLQKFWTFRNKSKDKLYSQAVVFFASSGINMLLNTFLVSVLVKNSHLFLSDSLKYYFLEKYNIWYLLSQMMVSSVIALESFLVYKYLIFKNKPDIGSRKKRILLATGIYPPDDGGPASYVKILEEELPNHNFEVKVITYSDEKNKKEDDGELIYKVKREKNILFRYADYFWHVFKMCFKTDVIYVQGVVSEGFPTSLACRLARKKYILKIVGDYAWEQGCQRFGVEEMLDEFQYKKYSFKVGLMRAMQKFTARGATKIIVPSNYLKGVVSKWGIDPDKIEVIYNAVKIREADYSSEEARSCLALSGKVILSVGRLVPWKGFPALIEAMKDVLKEHSDANLYIIGSGPLKEELLKKIEEEKLNEKVHLLGKLEREKVLMYMRAADVFVLNTAYEGLSHVLIEAMASGLPIFTTPVGGNLEIVEDENMLFAYNKEEKIAEKLKKYLGPEENLKIKEKMIKYNMIKGKDNMIKSLVKIIHENFKF